MHNIHLKTASVLLTLCAIAVKAQSTYLPIAPSALVSSEQKLPTESPQATPLAVGQSYALTPNPSAAVLPKPHVDLDAEHAYTLPELIDLAEREHPETRIAWETARNAALTAGIARSTYLPRMSANIIGGHQASSGSSSAFGVDTQGSESVTGSVSSVTLAWLLFDFGARRHAVDAAQKVSLASNILFTGVHQKIIHDVCVAYYLYLAASRNTVTAAKALQNTQEIQKAAEERYRGGIGTVLESTQTRQVTAQAQLARIQTEGAERNAYASLLGAMGFSALEKIKIAPLERHTFTDDTRPAIEQVVTDALSRRADVLAAYAAEQASQAAVKAAETAYRPKIFLAGTGAYVSGQLGLTAIPAIGEQQLPTLNITGNHWNSTVLLGLSVPIFDGHARANAISEAKNNSAKAAATLDQTRIVAIREIVGAQNALETSLAADEAARTLQDASQISYDAALDAYKHDVGTITAVVAAQTQLLQATLASDDAYSSTLSAAATLAFVSGTLVTAPR
jgi:outer membrane protein TolC